MGGKDLSKSGNGVLTKSKDKENLHEHCTLAGKSVSYKIQLEILKLFYMYTEVEKEVNTLYIAGVKFQYS